MFLSLPLMNQILFGSAVFFFVVYSVINVGVLIHNRNVGEKVKSDRKQRKICLAEFNAFTVCIFASLTLAAVLQLIGALMMPVGTPDSTRAFLFAGCGYFFAIAVFCAMAPVHTIISESSGRSVALGLMGMFIAVGYRVLPLGPCGSLGGPYAIIGALSLLIPAVVNLFERAKSLHEGSFNVRESKFGIIFVLHVLFKLSTVVSLFVPYKYGVICCILGTIDVIVEFLVDDSPEGIRR